MVFSGTTAKQCNSVQDSNEVGGACGRARAVSRLVWSATRFDVVEGGRMKVFDKRYETR